MKDFYDAIYLSPHFDDAALSCAGQIYDQTQQGKSILVVTIMGGNSEFLPASPFVEMLHNRWQLKANAVEARKAEDIAACHVMGTDWQHWDFLDCIYRVEPESGRPFYTSNLEIFGEIASAEIGLVNQIAERLAMLPASSQLVVPLTLGHHVDHQLTRLAAEQSFPPHSLLYYEDYPYARQVSAEEFVTVEPGDWQPKVLKITNRGLAARIKAISCFESQISTFFENPAELSRQVRAYSRSVGGERVWIRTKRWVN